MSCSHLCIPRNETVQCPYFQNRIIMFCFTISTLIYLWEIYIFPGSVCIFAAAKCVDRSWEYKNRSQTHECRNWDWGCAIPFPGIHKFDVRYSVSYWPARLHKLAGRHNSPMPESTISRLQPGTMNLATVHALQCCHKHRAHIGVK